MIYLPVKEMHGKHLPEDIMTAYQSVSQSCLDMRTLDYASGGSDQIGNDQLYGMAGPVSEGPIQPVSRAHSVGDLSTGLTLSLVGQRKADSMLNLTAVPLHNIQESVQSAFDSHVEVKANSANNSLKQSQMMSRHDRSKNQTNYTSPRQRSPLKGKRSLPNVPVSEASERIKRFTELMNARMALHSSASLHTTTPLSPRGDHGDPSSTLSPRGDHGDPSSTLSPRGDHADPSSTLMPCGNHGDTATPLACSDSEISDIFSRKAMIRDKSYHRGTDRESDYSMVHFDGRRASSKVNHSTERRGKSVHPVNHDQVSPVFFASNSFYRYISPAKSQNHLFEPVTPSSMQPGIRAGDRRFETGHEYSAREKPITSSQLAHYQEMVAALNNRQTESSFNVNLINNEFTRNFDAHENYSYNSVKSRPLSSQLVSSHSMHKSVGVARTDPSRHRDINKYNGSNKRYYGSQPNLNISQVKNNTETSGQTFISLDHTQPKLPCNIPERMERDYVNYNINYGSHSSTFSPIPLSTVTPNSSRRKTFQMPSKVELCGEAPRYSTLPGRWRAPAAEQGGGEGVGRRPPTLYQLAQVCSIHPCRVSLPLGRTLLQCLHLASKVLQLPALQPSPPDHLTPGYGPQGHFTASLGGPGSAFRPVHRSTSSTTPVVLVSVEQVTDSVSDATLPLSKGDIIVELNGILLLGADIQLVKKTMQQAQGEIFLTVARVKNHCTSLTVEQMMNEIDFLRAEIAERDLHLRELEARLGSPSGAEDAVPTEEVEISEDEFIV